MRLAIFDDQRLGLVSEDGRDVVDVSDLADRHDPGLGAGFWVRTCADLDALRSRVTAHAAGRPSVPVTDVTLRAPALHVSKVIGVASNYYVDESEEWRPARRSGPGPKFDVFLKAPSSIADPGATVALPALEGEIHYEGELGVIIGRPGREIAAEDAMRHVAGYTGLLDMTHRAPGERSKRKSYDGFTPVGPWMVTADGVGDWRDMHLELRLNGEVRQDVMAGEMIVGVPEIIEYASKVMTLQPGDVIATGAPSGVGKVEAGDRVDLDIAGIGRLAIDFS